MDFMDIADSLAAIASTGSTLSKEFLLARFGSEVEGFKEVLKFIYDPYFTTGLGQKKLNRCPIGETFTSVEEMMAYLRKNNTGTDVDAMKANGFILSKAGYENWEWAATGLVTKDLQIGVSVTTLNKVYGPGFIPKIGIMRGMLCPKDAHGIYIETEKIDGNRRLIMNKESGVEIYTRSGHRDDGLVEIAEQASRYLPKGFVYDTECIAVGDWEDNIACRQASASILNRRIGVKTGVRALMFDMLPQAEYDVGRSSWAAVFRKYAIAFMYNDIEGMNLLDTVLTDTQKVLIISQCNKMLCSCRAAATPNIHGLPILGIAHSFNEAYEHAKPIWESGGEGLMLNEYMSPYEVNPNPRKTLLKIKATEEFICRCVGVYEGTGRLQGTLGGIYLTFVASNGQQYTFGCGSGFPDYLRYAYWNDPSLIVGKQVEGDCFGESKNQDGGYSLNCPIFKKIRGEEE